MFYTQNNVYYRVFRVNNSMIPCGFVRYPSCCFTYSILLLHLSPCPFPKEPPFPVPHQIICILLFPFAFPPPVLTSLCPPKGHPPFPFLLTDHLCSIIPFSIAPQTPILQWSQCAFLVSLVPAFNCMCTCTHICGGQRITSGSWFSPSILWELGIELRSSGLTASFLTH